MEEDVRMREAGVRLMVVGQEICASHVTHVSYRLFSAVNKQVFGETMSERNERRSLMSSLFRSASNPRT